MNGSAAIEVSQVGWGLVNSKGEVRQVLRPRGEGTVLLGLDTGNAKNTLSWKLAKTDVNTKR